MVSGLYIFGARNIFILLFLKFSAVFVGISSILIDAECKTICEDVIKPNVCKLTAFTARMCEVAIKFDIYMKEVAPEI